MKYCIFKSYVFFYAFPKYVHFFVRRSFSKVAIWFENGFTVNVVILIRLYICLDKHNGSAIAITDT